MFNVAFLDLFGSVNNVLQAYGVPAVKLVGYVLIFIGLILGIGFGLMKNPHDYGKVKYGFISGLAGAVFIVFGYTGLFGWVKNAGTNGGFN